MHVRLHTTGRIQIKVLTTLFLFITARKRSLRRLCFYTCLSLCPQGGVCLSACWDTTPWDQTPPPGADSPWTRYPPSEQTPPGPGTPLGPGTPPAQCMLGAGGMHPTGIQSCFFNFWFLRTQIENLKCTFT